MTMYPLDDDAKSVARRAPDGHWYIMPYNDRTDDTACGLCSLVIYRTANNIWEERTMDSPDQIFDDIMSWPQT